MNNQRGEIATIITLVALGLMTVGIGIGTWAVKNPSSPFYSKATTTWTIFPTVPEGFKEITIDLPGFRAAKIWQNPIRRKEYKFYVDICRWPASPYPYDIGSWQMYFYGHPVLPDRYPDYFSNLFLGGTRVQPVYLIFEEDFGGEECLKNDKGLYVDISMDDWWVNRTDPNTDQVPLLLLQAAYNNSVMGGTFDQLIVLGELPSEQPTITPTTVPPTTITPTTTPLTITPTPGVTVTATPTLTVTPGGPTATPILTPTPTVPPSCSYDADAYICVDNNSNGECESNELIVESGFSTSYVIYDPATKAEITSGTSAFSGGTINFHTTNLSEDQRGKQASVTLNPNPGWQIVKSYCKGSGCPPNAGQAVAKLDGFSVGCGTDVDYGWILKPTSAGCENCVGGTVKRYPSSVWDKDGNGTVDDCEEACKAYFGPDCTRAGCGNPGSTYHGACCWCNTTSWNSCADLPTPTPGGGPCEGINCQWCTYKAQCDAAGWNWVDDGNYCSEPNDKWCQKPGCCSGTAPVPTATPKPGQATPTPTPTPTPMATDECRKICTRYNYGECKPAGQICPANQTEIGRCVGGGPCCCPAAPTATPTPTCVPNEGLCEFLRPCCSGCSQGSGLSCHCRACSTTPTATPTPVLACDHAYCTVNECGQTRCKGCDFCQPTATPKPGQATPTPTISVNCKCAYSYPRGRDVCQGGCGGREGELCGDSGRDTSWCRGAGGTGFAPVAVDNTCELNGVVNARDYSIIIANYGRKGGRGDANGDGVTNALDLSLVLKYLGKKVEPST